MCTIHVYTGQLCMECKQIYNTGLRSYVFDSYNFIDFTVLSLYLASYTLRFLVDRWIKTADAFYNGTNLARDSLLERNRTEYELIVSEIFSDNTQPLHSYFMKACTCVYSYAIKYSDLYVFPADLLQVSGDVSLSIQLSVTRRNGSTCFLYSIVDCEHSMKT